MPAAAAVPQSQANMAGVFGAQQGQVGAPPPPFSGAPNSIQQPGVTAGQGQQPQQPQPAPGGVGAQPQQPPQQAPQQGASSDGSFKRPDGSTDWEVGSGPKYDWGGMSARTGRAPTSPAPPEADSVDPTRGSAWRQAQAAHDAWIQSQLKSGLSLADLGFSPTRGGGLSIYMRYGGPGGLGEQLQQQGGGAAGNAPGGGAPTSGGPGTVGIPGGEGTQQGGGTVGIPGGEPGAARPGAPAPPMLAQNSAGQANRGGLLADPAGGQFSQQPMGVNLGGANANQGLQQAMMQLLMSRQGAQGLPGGVGAQQGQSGTVNPNDIYSQLFGTNPGGIYQGTMSPK